MTTHEKQTAWLTQQEVNEIHASLIAKHPIFKDAEFVRKDSEGIINMFEFWNEDTDVFTYHDLNGVKMFDSLDLMANERTCGGYFGI
jgi:hypothetical protein